jgi:hypothetical protein
MSYVPSDFAQRVRTVEMFVLDPYPAFMQNLVQLPQGELRQELIILVVHESYKHKTIVGIADFIENVGCYDDTILPRFQQDLVELLLQYIQQRRITAEYLVQLKPFVHKLLEKKCGYGQKFTLTEKYAAIASWSDQPDVATEIKSWCPKFNAGDADADQHWNALMQTYDPTPREHDSDDDIDLLELSFQHFK